MEWKDVEEIARLYALRSGQNKKQKVSENTKEEQKDQGMMNERMDKLENLLERLAERVTRIQSNAEVPIDVEAKQRETESDEVHLNERFMVLYSSAARDVHKYSKIVKQREKEPFGSISFQKVFHQKPQN